MSLGAGIFGSTILVLIALAVWRISVAHKWRTVGKVFGILFAIGCVTAGALYAYNVYADRPKPLDGIDGMKLGMSPLDVQLLRGVPVSKQDEVIAGEARTRWFYQNEKGELEYFLLFGKPGLHIVCRMGRFAGEFGLGYGTTEEDAIGKLGRPTNVSVNKEGLEKALSFSKYRVGLSFKQGQLTDLCVTDTGKLKFAEEYSATATAAPNADEK
jgi:hypothetical protein